MLLIGNKASQKHGCTFGYDNLEIIHNKEELPLILKKLNIKSKPYYTKRGVSYYEDNSQLLKLYDVEMFKGLQGVLKTNTNISLKLKNCDAVTNYAYYRAAIKYRRVSVHEWESYLYKYLFYRNLAINTIHNDFSKEFNVIYGMFMFPMTQETSVITNPYVYNFTEPDVVNTILDCMTLEDNKPLFKKIIFSDVHYRMSKPMFERFSYDEQIDCVLEKIKTDVITEYLINAFKNNTYRQSNVLNYYKTAIMNLATNTIYPQWFTDFIMHNYVELLEKYEPDFAVVALDMYRIGMLESENKILT